MGEVHKYRCDGEGCGETIEYKAMGGSDWLTVLVGGGVELGVYCSTDCALGSLALRWACFTTQEDELKDSWGPFPKAPLQIPPRKE